MRILSGRKAALSTLCVALALALGLAACGGGSSSTGGSTTGSEGGKEGGTLTVSYGSAPAYLDPALGLSPESLNSFYDTYIPLLTYKHADGEAGGEVVPGLATALPKISDGGKTYEMTLRKGLKYSNGQPVVASDFTHAIERVLALNSPGAPFYESIVGAQKFLETKQGGVPGIEADDESGKITIHLESPRGTFENELALPLAAPVPAKTPNKDLSASPPPATGPYVIVASKIGRGWEYLRNPQWKKTNEKLVPEVPSGHVDKIEVQILRNPSTQVNDVEQGKTDWMANQPPADRYAAVKEKYEGTQFKVESTLSTYFFWMNTKVAPFDDPQVRQAVNYAIDPRALERIYAGQLVGTQQVLPPGMSGYDKLDLYPHDLKKAKELIAEAAPTDKKIDVWGDTESPNKEAVEYYGGVLEELGFDVTLKIVNSDNYFTLIGNEETPNVDTGFANWFAEYSNPNAFFQPMFAEAGIPSTNLARFADKKVSDQIEKLAGEELTSAQEGEYAALDKEVMEAAPWAPYGNSTAAVFVSSAIDLEGVQYSPTFGPDLATFQFK